MLPITNISIIFADRISVLPASTYAIASCELTTEDCKRVTSAAFDVIKQIQREKDQERAQQQQRTQHCIVAGPSYPCAGPVHPVHPVHPVGVVEGTTMTKFINQPAQQVAAQQVAVSERCVGGTLMCLFYLMMLFSCRQGTTERIELSVEGG